MLIISHGISDFGYINIWIHCLWRKSLNSKCSKIFRWICIIFAIALIAISLIDDSITNIISTSIGIGIPLFVSIWYLIYYVKLEVKKSPVLFKIYILKGISTWKIFFSIMYNLMAIFTIQLNLMKLSLEKHMFLKT